jgi:hypothetical protein
MRAFTQQKALAFFFKEKIHVKLGTYPPGIKGSSPRV